MATGADQVLPGNVSAYEASASGPATTGAVVIKDPKVQEIISRGPTQYMTARQRVERYLSWVLLGAVALLSVGYFTVRAVANQASLASAKAGASVQASCRFWHDLAELPLTPQTTKTGYQIVADAYIAYFGLDCAGKNGKLPAPAQQVADLIPPGIR
jgi:hypothetical protein